MKVEEDERWHVRKDNTLPLGSGISDLSEMKLGSCKVSAK